MPRTTLGESRARERGAPRGVSREAVEVGRVRREMRAWGFPEREVQTEVERVQARFRASDACSTCHAPGARERVVVENVTGTPFTVHICPDCEMLVAPGYTISEEA